MPPPHLRKLILISVSVLLLAVGVLAGNTHYSVAQTPMVDYDLDDDGLIDVSTADQWRAIHYDLNGDGTPETRGAPRAGTNADWATAYPNAMPGAGCPARDHDDDPSTPDQASCIGFELINDVDLANNGLSIGMTGSSLGEFFSAKIVGNGFAIMNNRRIHGSSTRPALFGRVRYDAVIEGLAVLNPQHGGTGIGGGIAGRLEGTVIGSYVEGGRVFENGRNGGIAGRVTTHPTNGYALIAHSYVRGTNIGSNSIRNGGLAGQFEHQRGTNPVYQATCLNSYFSGDVDSATFSSQRGTITGENERGEGRFINCVGDSTTDANDGQLSTTGTGAGAGSIAATNAAMKAATGYTGPFAGWDDYPVDGSIAQLDASEPRTDVWYFGDSDTLPVLKAWGHDRTIEMSRTLSGTDTVNLCTRTLAVANEIIRHLKDNVRRAGVTSTPADVTALTGCNSADDTQEVTITNLTDLVVTNASHTFNLGPDRTVPESERLTSLVSDDLAYLTNVSHVDLGGNELESIPPRLFQGLPLRWLNLSNNNLTSLPADLFRGVEAVTTVGGNSLLLNGNSLTDTGIPGRIFDSMTHLNGLDLSDNSLTRVNTRWFEQLANLGRKASTTPPYTHALGLHIGGNALTEHYYSQKLFSGIRENVVSYADTTAAGPPAVTTAAGDALRTAIIAAITAAAGGTTPTTLDLAGTDYWYNTTSPPAYQASTVTACTASQTAAPGRYEYLGGTPPDCQIQPHWSPPHKPSDSRTSAPSFGTTSGNRGTLSAQISHTNNAAFVAYQVRHRPGEDERWSPWQVVPITLATGSKDFTISAPESGISYQVELRALSADGPPSAAASTTISTPSANFLAGVTVAASTSTVGSVELAWNAINPESLPLNHAVTAYYYRYKPQSETLYSAWIMIPDGDDAGSLTSDETSYSIRGLPIDASYDVQMVGGIDTDADGTNDYLTGRRTAVAVPLTVPANLNASSGTMPGTIALTWNMQTLATTAQAKFQVRRKLRTLEGWGGVDWTDVPDSTGPDGDADTDAHNETGYTISGLTGGAVYDIQVRLHQSDALGGTIPSSATATAAAVPTPTGFTATQGTFGNINLSWTQQSDTANSEASYQFRMKKASDPWLADPPFGWSTISGSDHSTDSHAIDELEVGFSYDFELRFRWSNAIGTSQAVSVSANAMSVLTAQTGDSIETIEVNWLAQTQTTASNARFQTRHRTSPDGTWTAWSDVPDSNDPNSHTYDETSRTLTGLTSYRQYDIETRLATGSTAGPAARVLNIRAGYYPRNLKAVPGDVPGTIAVTWDLQTVHTETSSSPGWNTDRRYGVRVREAGTENWGGWYHPIHSATGQIIDRTTPTTGTLLTKGEVYQVQTMFERNTNHNWPDLNFTPGIMNVQAALVRPPTNVTAATANAAASAVTLSWDEQTESTDSNSKFQYRYRTSPSGAWGSWTDVADGSDSDSNAYNESSVNVTGLTAGTTYDFELRFHWDSTHGESTSVSATATASATPAPGGFSAIAGSAAGSVDLSWNLVDGADDYRYRYKLKSAGSYPASGAGAWTAVTDQDSDSAVDDEDAVTVTGLTGGSEYDFQIQARVSTTAGLSSSADATAQTQSPPRNATFAAGSAAGEIDITWDAPSSGTPTGYEYRYKLSSATSYPSSGTRTGSGGTWADVDDSDSDGDLADERAHTIDELWGGVSYDVQIRTKSAAGPSLPGTATMGTVVATAVAAPTNFTVARGTGPGEINLAWTVLASSTMHADHSVVQYQFRTKLANAAANTYTAWTNIPAANTTSYTVTGLAAYTLHDIQLRAAIDDGDTDSLTNYYSSAATQGGIRTGLAVPANLRATGGATPGSIELTWTTQTTFGPSFITADYQYRTKLPSASWPSGGGWMTISGSDINTDSLTIDNLTNGQLYDVEVRFRATSQLVSEGAAIQATPTAVAVPTGLSATTSTGAVGAIHLSWTPQSAITVSSAEYQVRVKLPSATWTGVLWSEVPDSARDSDSDKHNEDRHTIIGLSAGVRYDVQVRFFMSSDIGGSTPVSASATASSVPVPTGFDATTGSGAGQIALSWDAITGVTGYQYRYKLGSASSYPAQGATGDWTSAGTGTSATIMNLTGGEFYDVQLRAQTTGIGESEPTATMRAQAQTTPGPATLTFSHGDDPGDIKIDWTAPANNAPVEHYEYRYKRETASDSAYSAWAEVMDSTDSGNSQDDEVTYTIADLQAGVSYHVQFRVYASSTIRYSIPQRGTQTARPIPPPTAFRAIGGANPGEVNLSWTAPASVTILRYELRHRLGTTGAWSTWTASSATTSHAYTGLSAGMLRTFQLRAVMETVGASAPLATTGTPTPVPMPRRFMATTGTFPGEIDMNWQAVTGATNYEYRIKLDGESWPTEEDWESISGALTSLTLTTLNEGAIYDIALRVVISNVGRSSASNGQAATRSGIFRDTQTTPTINPGYAISGANVPGRIAVDLPGNGESFTYRHRTANPGEWSRWFKVTPSAGQEQFLIPNVDPGVRYEIQVRAYTGMATGFTTALAAEAQAAPLEAPTHFDAQDSSGVILLTWSGPSLYTPDSYEYRTRPTGTQQWSEWTTVPHQGDRGSTQRRYITGLETGISHDFELRMQTQSGPSPAASSSASARIRVPEVHSIKPDVRSISVRAGDLVLLTVNVYNAQEVLDNTLPDKPDSLLRFQWSEQGTAGGGTFGTTDNGRRVSYTAPSTPGRYTVQAEARPDGVCMSHHAGASEITAAERAPCIATFTISVSRAPAELAPQPEPINPPGAIPSSMTDDAGVAYSVFTPVDGGMFSGEGFTASASAGAVPDRTLLGISGAVSAVPVPAPIPGASMSIAGRFYDINAITQDGYSPLSRYTLDDPLTVCLPYPDEFRAELANIVAVERKHDGALGILTTKVRSNAGVLTVCGAISTLPATVGVAKLGTVPAIPPTPMPTEPLPETGGAAPSVIVLALIFLAGLTLLTGMRRISRITS